MRQHWTQGNHWRPLICGTCLLAAIFINVSIVTNTWAIKSYNYEESNTIVTYKLGLWEECQETQVIGKHTQDSTSSETKSLIFIDCHILGNTLGFLAICRRMLIIACILCYSIFIYSIVLLICVRKTLYGWMTVPSLLTALLCSSIFVIILKNILSPSTTFITGESKIINLKDYVMGWSFYYFVFGYLFLVTSMFFTLKDKDKGRTWNNSVTPMIGAISPPDDLDLHSSHPSHE
ncbi:uncharacterized protein [Clytia hemisphaerica]|uniref:uncharacterized protein n=1 Tax=Clytia hemisphaerica TaxID=252671 RepID=UPI0034D7B3FF